MSRSFKKAVSFVYFFFLSIGTPFIAHAFLAEGIAFVLLGVIIALLLGVSNVILMVAIWILQWVLSESFIDWGYTHNPMIDIGWGLTRDLGNMFFVIYLAFVGLATALRIEKYKTQKILPTLILVALLVNFSPVICGVIVDASNILMSFFLSESGGGGWQAFATQVENLKTGILGGGLGQALNPIKIVGVYVQAIILVVFNIVAAGLYILFAFLFAARYIAIWLLVILSPLAFFSLAVPDLKSFWTKWWDMFIQWCFVGVTASFFLYLGHHMMVQADSMMGSVAPQEGVLGILTGAMIELLHFIIPYGIALGFLGIGFFAALSSSAKGANIAIKGAKLAGGAVKGAAGYGWDRFRTSEKGKETAKGVAEGPPAPRKLFSREGREEWKEALGKASPWKKVGMATRAVIPFGGFAGRYALEAVRTGRKDLEDKAEQRAKDYAGQEDLLESRVKDNPKLDWKNQIVDTLALAKVGGSQSLDRVEEDNPGHIQNVLKMIAEYGSRKMTKDLVKYRLNLILDIDVEQEDWRKEVEDTLGKIKLPKNATDEQKEEALQKVYGALPETGRMIVKQLVYKGFEDDDVQELLATGEWTAGEAMLGAAYRKVMESIKNKKDVADLDDKTRNSSLFQEVMLRHGKTNIIKEVVEQGGEETAKRIERTMERIGAASLMRSNKQFMRLATFSAFWKGLMKPPVTQSEYHILDGLDRIDGKLLRLEDITKDTGSIMIGVQRGIAESKGNFTDTAKELLAQVPEDDQEEIKKKVKDPSSMLYREMKKMIEIRKKTEGSEQEKGAAKERRHGEHHGAQRIKNS